MTKTKSDDKPMTKTAAVKAAVAAGVEKPADGVAYIKEKFGLNMTGQQFSVYKNQARKQNGSPQKKEGIASVSKNGSPIELARQVKKLVDAYGADAVKGMAEVFAE